MGVEITVIDESDTVGWLAAATRTGEIYMTDVASMVANVLAESGSKSIDRLNILDHGSSNGLEIGTDWIGSHNVQTFAPTLRRLAPKFSTNGFVHLQHCSVGQNRPLLLELAKIFNASVYATPNYSNPIYRVNLGGTEHRGWLSGHIKVIPNPFVAFEDYVRADPDGTFDESADRP